MATELDLTLPIDIRELIAQFGKAVTFTAKPTGHVPSTGAVSATTPTSYSAVVTPPGPVARRLSADSLAVEADAGCMLAADGLTFTPAVGWTVTIDGVSWLVVSVESIYVGDLVGAYAIGMVRA
jgi:hypothetical protein